MAGRDLGLMILARESFGKLLHIPKNGLVGPIRRYYGSHARHFQVLWKMALVRTGPLSLMDGAARFGSAAITLLDLHWSSRSL
ncbi:hypothetical protein ACRQ5Q_43085 (plasmid) [Bradyrhizobium sp. PMVTL-01]|uniref:hypothetical protein n=1 Tax=Bradyrhizobium sp. PMVTL-01 TaxID=3434999 RepID=UPI003F707FFC